MSVGEIILTVIGYIVVMGAMVVFLDEEVMWKPRAVMLSSLFWPITVIVGICSIFWKIGSTITRSIVKGTWD